MSLILLPKFSIFQTSIKPLFVIIWCRNKKRTFNLIEAGLFEGRFFLEIFINLHPPPPIPFLLKSLKLYQYNFIQLLNNLFQVFWKCKYADTIFYKVTSLVSYGFRPHFRRWIFRKTTGVAGGGRSNSLQTFFRVNNFLIFSVEALHIQLK